MYKFLVELILLMISAFVALMITLACCLNWDAEIEEARLVSRQYVSHMQHCNRTQLNKAAPATTGNYPILKQYKVNSLQ